MSCITMSLPTASINPDDVNRSLLYVCNRYDCVKGRQTEQVGSFGLQISHVIHQEEGEKRKDQYVSSMSFEVLTHCKKSM